MLKKRAGVKIFTTSKSEKKIEEKVLVGTLGVDCFDLTQQLVDSIRSNAKELKFFYVDNGSTPETIEKIKQWKIINPFIDTVEIKINGKNLGVAAGWNQVARAGIEWGASKIFIVNNDIVFHEKTIDNLIEAFNRLHSENENVLLVTSNNVTRDPKIIKSSSITMEWHNVPHPDFACFMISPETIEKVGEFWEELYPAYFEDNEYHNRMLLMGYVALRTYWSPYCHLGTRTRNTHINLVTHEQFRENEKRFHERMLVDTTDQKVCEDRYHAWLEQNPDVPHPSFDQIMNWVKAHEL